jgi:hypothetical protein
MAADAKGKRVLKLVGGIFAVVGLALLGAAYWTGNRQLTIIKSWPTIQAEVTKSQVTHHLSHDSERSTDTMMYEAEIEFRYTLNGKEYVTPSNPGYSTSSYPEMKRLADTFAPGTTHLIRYNPADPNDIRFNAGYSFGFFFLPVLFGGMGIVFGGIGTGLLIASRSRESLRCPSCGQGVDKGQKFCPNCAALLQTNQ